MKKEYMQPQYVDSVLKIYKVVPVEKNRYFSDEMNQRLG